MDKRASKVFSYRGLFLTPMPNICLSQGGSCVLSSVPSPCLLVSNGSSLFRLTVLPGSLSEAERIVAEAVDEALFDFDDDVQPIEGSPRPMRRSECASGPRPCVWVTCRYNLYLDVRGDGILRLNFPDREPEEMVASCVLDLAADGPRTLDSVAGLMGMSKERARQIEAVAIQKVRKAFRKGY